MFMVSVCGIKSNFFPEIKLGRALAAQACGQERRGGEGRVPRGTGAGEREGSLFYEKALSAH